MSSEETVQTPSEPEATVLYEVKKKVATITLNRPAKMNSLRFEEMEAIDKYLKKANLDPKVRVIRLKSSGSRVFIAGLDLGMVSKLQPEDFPDLIIRGNAIVRTCTQVKKPIVVQVQGPAVGWGCIASFAADFLIVGENPKTFFQLPEIDVGIFPATGALTMALKNLSHREAKKMLLIPHKYFIDEFEKLGMITKRFPLEDLDKETYRFCRSLAKKVTSILYLTKAIINKIHLDDLEDCFALEAQALKAAATGDVDKYEEFVKSLWPAEFDPKA